MRRSALVGAVSRGFGAAEFREVGALITRVLDALAQSPEDNGATEQEVQAKVEALCRRFPIYPGMVI